MAFAVEISEVTEAEFPLMDVLRDTVFGEFGFVSRAPLERGLADKKDLFLLMAHLEGNPVGFSGGCRRKPFDFYINYVAVLKDYRRQGLGREFVTRMEGFARSRGYERIEFNTQNRFPGMMRLGLKLGYRPIGLEQHDGTMYDLQIRFGKTFDKDEPIDARLLAAIEAGDEIAGMLRERSGRLRIILRSEAP
jgi:GNAT superfamily N-acetyltransferase